MPYKDREKRLAYSREYNKLWYPLNRDIRNENSKKWYENNPIKRKEIKHRYNIKNRKRLTLWTQKYRTKNPEKYIAFLEFKNAIRHGIIKRQPCEICGNLKSQGHHENYLKPLEVIWLCAKHHNEITHKQKGWI